jgi:DNA-binding GntR family transcriptional regulator
VTRPGGLEPVSRESTASIIANQLRDAICYGTLPPGTQMAETELAARLRVSRGPLREAMQRLVQEGLLRSERHRGLFVIRLDADDVRDVYAARTAIERAACELILRREPEEAAARLEEIVEQMLRAAADGDARAVGDADYRFHEALVAASGSPRLVRMQRTLLVETRMCMTALEDKYQAPSELTGEHAAIAAAVRTGPLESLLHLVDEHMQDALTRLAPPASELAAP